MQEAIGCMAPDAEGVRFHRGGIPQMRSSRVGVEAMRRVMVLIVASPPNEETILLGSTANTLPNQHSTKNDRFPIFTDAILCSS
jgi:hypothetical protein